jgi:hypothetical protein
MMRLALAREIDHKTASVLLYALQTATINVGQLGIGPEGQIDRDAQAIRATRMQEQIASDTVFQRIPLMMQGKIPTQAEL